MSDLELPPAKEKKLARKFAETHREFQAALHTIAHNAQLPALKVFSWWLQYTVNCDKLGWMPSVPEFQKFYAWALTPEKEAA